MGHRSNDESGALDPASIADQRFPVRFRGYDRAAVALHLARVAEAHEAALDAVRAAEARIEAEPAVDDGSAFDDGSLPEDEEAAADEVARRFGDDLAEVVRTTRARVLEIEADAARRADEAVARAEQQAARIVQAAQARADHLTAVHDRLVARLVDTRAELAEVLDKLDEARLEEPSADEPPAVIDLSDPDVETVGSLEGEDDPAFDRMVRDALERAVRLGRSPADDA